jgi:hypothetical protein
MGLIGKAVIAKKVAGNRNEKKEKKEGEEKTEEKK